MMWRLIADDGVPAAFGLAADEVLAQNAGGETGQAALRLYTYRPWCALAGRFQNIENELHLDYCRANGIEINRRPTGGGAIIMGSGQLGIALTLPGRGRHTYGHARELMARFSAGIRSALAEFGIEAGFRRKNDLEVGGRKIAGLGIYRDPAGGLLFHASLLIDLDISLMLNILKTPFEKISDKEIKTVAGRITTMRRESGTHLTLQEVRRSIARSYARTFDITLAPDEFSPAELGRIYELQQKKYNTAGWIFQESSVADGTGCGKVKTPAGLIDVRVAMAGKMLKAVHIGGDFFAPESAIAELEGRLRWHSGDAGAIEQTVRAVYAEKENELAGVPVGALLRAISRAVADSEHRMSGEKKEPYGCFVTPEGSHV